MSEGVTPALAKAFHEKEVGGALVSEVKPDSPAAHAGIEKGDIILSVNGKPVNDNAQLRMTISLMQPGTAASLRLLRDGAEREVSAKRKTENKQTILGNVPFGSPCVIAHIASIFESRVRLLRILRQRSS